MEEYPLKHLPPSDETKEELKTATTLNEGHPKKC
jgi:hypothetical protein